MEFREEEGREGAEEVWSWRVMGAAHALVSFGPQLDAALAFSGISEGSIWFQDNVTL